jgi:hypothetical protein
MAVISQSLLMVMVVSEILICYFADIPGPANKFIAGIRRIIKSTTVPPGIHAGISG